VAGTFDFRKNWDFYRSKAEECEKAAARAKDPRVREDWLKVAAGYRQLANPN
jgi:hypothetical protein